MTKSEHGNTGKRSALKDGRTAHLHIRINPEFKAEIDSAVGDGSRSDWVIAACKEKLERSRSQT